MLEAISLKLSKDIIDKVGPKKLFHCSSLHSNDMAQCGVACAWRVDIGITYPSLSGKESNDWMIAPGASVPNSVLSESSVSIFASSYQISIRCSMLDLIMYMEG